MPQKPVFETLSQSPQQQLEIDRDFDKHLGSTLGKLLWLAESALNILCFLDPMPWYRAAEPLVCDNDTRYARYRAVLRTADQIRARLYATTPRAELDKELATFRDAMMSGRLEHFVSPFVWSVMAIRLSIDWLNATGEQPETSGWLAALAAELDQHYRFIKRSRPRTKVAPKTRPVRGRPYTWSATRTA